MRIGKDAFRILPFGFRTRGERSVPSASRHPRAAIGGFTLAEVLVASTISGFIAVVAVGALKAVADSAQAVNQAGEATAEVRFAARLLARDLANLYRDPNPQNMKLIGISQGANTGGSAFLTFYMAGRSKARADQPEGDIYEVEYLLGTRQAEQTAAGAEPQTESTVLFRRLWPNPDEERSPGGILTPIAENIDLFQVRFFDGEQWSDEWPEEMKSLPELLEITLVTQPQGRREPVAENFLVHFPRLAEGAAASGASETQNAGQDQSQPAPQSTAEQGGSTPAAPTPDNSTRGSSTPGNSRNDGGARNSTRPRSGGRR